VLRLDPVGHDEQRQDRLVLLEPRDRARELLAAVVGRPVLVVEENDEVRRAVEGIEDLLVEQIGRGDVVLIHEDLEPHPVRDRVKRLVEPCRNVR
jgi:hypothetical protein